MILDYLKISDNEIKLLDFMLRGSTKADFQIKVKALSLVTDLLAKRSDLETFMTRMVLIKGNDELELFKKYSELAYMLSTSMEALKLRIYTEEVDRTVDSSND